MYVCRKVKNSQARTGHQPRDGWTTEVPVVMPLARVLAEEGASVVEACMVEWDRRGFGTSRGEDGAAAWRRSVYSAFGQLSVAARGAMVEVLVAEYNCSYICGREWCRRQGERHRWRVEVWWPGRGSLVVMGEGIAGEVEGWREQVRAWAASAAHRGPGGAAARRWLGGREVPSGTPAGGAAGAEAVGVG